MPAIGDLAASFEAKASAWSDVVKIGRTHLQDAVPLTFGQEISGWAAQLRSAAARIEAGFEELRQIPLGGTAVGTGLNTHPEFGVRVAAERDGHLRAGRCVQQRVVEQVDQGLRYQFAVAQHFDAGCD